MYYLSFRIISLIMQKNLLFVAYEKKCFPLLGVNETKMKLIKKNH